MNVAAVVIWKLHQLREERAMARVPKTQTYSIFGQIEEVAAEMMVDEGKIIKIPQDEIPESALWGDNPLKPGEKLKAKFAVIVPRERQAEFDTLIAQLRA